MNATGASGGPHTGRAAELTSAALALLGFALEIFAFWPGLMSVDSVEQYTQAVLGRYNDHHPPIMSWVWSWTNRVIVGPGGMLAFHLAMLWIGLWAIAEGARRHGLRYAWLIVPVGVLPFIASIAGVIWKDLGMAYALLCAGGLLYLAETCGEGLRRTVIAVALLLIAYATLVRANGAFAALALAVYAAAMLFPRIVRGHTVAIGVAFVALVLGGQQLLERKLLDASPRHLSQLVMLFDLAGMACSGVEVDIPAAFLAPGYDRAVLCRAYDPDQVDTLLFAPTSPLQQSFDADAVRALRRSWIGAALANPGPYLAHRTHSFTGLLGLHEVPRHYRYLRQPYMQSNPWGFAFTPNALSSALDASVDALADSWVFNGALWVVVATVLLALIAVGRLRASFEEALLASALMNALPYFVFSLAPNYRFIYWTVLATTVALTLLALRLISAAIRHSGTAVAPAD
jgi:hypothetical protein